VWATSLGYNITPEEMKEIVACLSGTAGAIDKAYADGLHIAKERFVLTGVEEEDKILLGRKGREGVVITQSNLAILVAHYADGMIAGNTRSVVESLRDYLKKSNY